MMTTFRTLAAICIPQTIGFLMAGVLVCGEANQILQSISRLIAANKISFGIAKFDVV